MSAKVIGWYEQLPQIAVAVGATSPDPGATGVLAWSTTVGGLVAWDGTRWTKALALGPFGGGDVVAFLPNAATPPGSNPSGGGYLYCDSGSLKYRGSGGTTTTLAPA